MFCVVSNPISNFLKAITKGKKTYLLRNSLIVSKRCCTSEVPSPHTVGFFTTMETLERLLRQIHQPWSSHNSIFDQHKLVFLLWFLLIAVILVLFITLCCHYIKVQRRENIALLLSNQKREYGGGGACDAV